MVKSTVIPNKGPLKFAVYGFGHTPAGLPTINVNINNYIDHEFCKRLGKWIDQEGCIVPEEEAEFLDTIWIGECKKVGLEP